MITKPIRGMDLKYRQGGVSTFWLLFWLDETLWHRNTTTGIQAHKKESLNYLWDIIRFSYDNLPDAIKPPLSEDSKSSLEFADRNSKIFISLSIRSTTLHNLHISEIAYCDDNEVKASIGACSPTTNITLETTGNGIGNMAYEVYQDAKGGQNEFTARFNPWFIQNEYRIPLNGISPISVLNTLSPDERKLSELMKKKGYDLEAGQVLWRRQSMRTFRDLFPQEYPETDRDAFLASGVMFFDANKIEALYRESRDWWDNQKPYAVDDKFNQWVQFYPYEKGHHYAAGADPAEGGGDNSVLKIIDVTGKKEVFVFIGQVNVNKFYLICDEWCRYYNNSLLGVERNNHGHAVLMGLDQNCQYPNLFDDSMLSGGTRLKIDEFPKRKLGWNTNEQSRALMLDHLKMAVEGDPDDDVDNFDPVYTIFDKDFLKEALTFKQVEGKFQAVAGKFDDDLIASAIAYQMYQIVLRHRTVSIQDSYFASGKRITE